jgi:hypothetical protein
LEFTSRGIHSSQKRTFMVSPSTYSPIITSLLSDHSSIIRSLLMTNSPLILLDTRMSSKFECVLELNLRPAKQKELDRILFVLYYTTTLIQRFSEDCWFSLKRSAVDALLVVRLRISLNHRGVDGWRSQQKFLLSSFHFSFWNNCLFIPIPL